MTLELPRPKFISFDVYGTLIHFQMREAVTPLLADRITGDDLEVFLRRFRTYRYDEILEYRPYDVVLDRAFRRACEESGIEARDTDVGTILDAVLTWGPHADVPAALRTMADHFPLVALSNADKRHLDASIPKLGAPFRRVISAEEAGAYKPRVRAFHYMLETLDAEPADFLHIAAHQIYDHIPMHDLGFTNKVYLDRGYEPDLPQYGAVRVTSLDEVNRALGIA
ncbi:2-haloacid dehalogenase [Agrococcus sp. UYP10]|uniref:haloacid dehalogenase type II n=1 Tax=Agrococcus sp. UYP10 TaxID=1756355 RepID=UPI0033946BAA